jgi:hypothetical protein
MGSVAKAQESVDLAVGAVGMYAVNGQSPKDPKGNIAQRVNVEKNEDLQEGSGIIFIYL